MTEWRDIPGYEGRYKVSSDGDVYSISSGKSLAKNPDRQGYFGVSLYKGTKKSRKRWPIHVLVMLTFVGERPEGLDICHNNGDKTDNRLANLRYGTRSENILDSVAHGTHVGVSAERCRLGHLIGIRYDRASGCRACARAGATVSYYPELAEFRDRIADIHYKNMMGENRRLLISEIRSLI